MPDIDAVWSRIRAHAGEQFQTVLGIPFTYEVPGNYLRVTRDGREVNRSLSRTNFAKGLLLVPTEGPTGLKSRQGSSYTWAILMDPRIRLDEW